jgi:hypothetical protein
MAHIVLLGDSVFDNAPYVARGEEVVEHLRRRLPRAGRPRSSPATARSCPASPNRFGGFPRARPTSR